MTQEQAYNEFIPYINDTGKIYRKISPIYGRLAIENEYIETWTEDGLETTNYAKIGKSAIIIDNTNSRKSEYQKYKDSQNSYESDEFYKKADDLHKISLISGGLAATIYLHDIIWVISKGSQNLKKSKSLRNQVNENPIIIRNQKIKL